MTALNEEMSSLFNSISREMNSVNSNWSANLAQNFSGKIDSVNSSFSSLSSLFTTGAEAAMVSAESMESVDKYLANQMVSPETIVAANGSVEDKKSLWNWAEYGVSKVVDKVENLVSDYKNKGKTFKTVQYGKCAVKATSAIVKIVGGAIATATLVGAPLGMISIISGIDTLNNVSADYVYIQTEGYDQIGTTHYLKDLLTEKGKELGDYFGNERVGEVIGKVTYYGFNLVTLLDSADKMLQNLGKLDMDLTDTSRYSFMWGWKSFDEIEDTNTWKLLYEAGKSVKKVLEKAWKFGETLAEGL